MKFAWIDAEEANWPVVVMCGVLQVSTSGFYAWRSRDRAPDPVEVELRAQIRAIHAHGRGAYGSPRVHAELRRRGVRIGRRRVIALMREEGVQGRSRRSRVRTTDSRHDEPVAPNLLSQDFAAEGPDQKWAGDVTYLRSPDGWLYLAVLLDLHSRQVVGWALSRTNDRWLALRALEQAVTSRRPKAGLIHHTDRGSPYASKDYRARLEQLGFRPSMSAAGDCYDNSPAESWFATLKAELGDSFESMAHAQRQLFDFIEVFYNRQRLHSALGMRSPAEYERRQAAA